MTNGVKCSAYLATGYLFMVAAFGQLMLARPLAAQVWDWQLSPPFNLQRAVDVIDLDPDNHSRADILRLNRKGVYTICYVSVGTLEDFRDDVDQFPSAVIGRVYGDWPDERFLDVRALDVLLPLMKARFLRCKDMGFAAIEPDNMDGHDNRSGFPLRRNDTVKYVKALAGIAHAMGLEIGQKNVPKLTRHLEGTLDFVVAESCWQDRWCDQLAAYGAAGKDIFDAEYSDRPVDFLQACRDVMDLGISMILKDRDLTGFFRVCPSG